MQQQCLQVAYVGQEPALHHATILDNVCYGCPEANIGSFSARHDGIGKAVTISEDAIRAAEDANAHDFIQETTLGYDTMCGERGAQMSGNVALRRDNRLYTKF